MHAQIQAMCLITSANTNYRFRYRPDIHTHKHIHTWIDRTVVGSVRFGTDCNALWLDTLGVLVLVGLFICSFIRSFVRFVRFGWSHPCRDADLIAHLRCRKFNLLVQINRERVEWSGVGWRIGSRLTGSQSRFASYIQVKTCFVVVVVVDKHAHASCLCICMHVCVSMRSLCSYLILGIFVINLLAKTRAQIVNIS